MSGGARFEIDRDYLVATARELIGFNSINPAFSGRTTDESRIAALVAEELERLGLTVDAHEPEPGRTSVVGRLAGGGGGRSLMLYAHLDTVGVEGMSRPFSAEVRDGRIYGRGAYDMKGSLAACLTAVKALAGAGFRPAGDVLFVAVSDEEVASIGMADVLTRHTADAAIVTESTELALCIAHKGFCWIEVETLGRAAHGSRYEEGVDANMRMGRFLAQLDRLEQALRASTPHPLLGPPSLHAGVLRGGTGASTYAARCRLEIERRTLPIETEEDVLAEIRSIVDRLSAEDPSFRARVAPLLTRGGFEIAPEAPIVRLLSRVTRETLGRVPLTIGQPYWMDAALLAGAGVQTVVIGPSGAGAHAVEEWVDVASLVSLAEILARTTAEFCGAGRAASETAA